MPEPIPEQILQNLDALFVSIDATASGSAYFNTIGVNQYLRADAAVVEVETGPFPFVVLATTNGTVQTSHTESTGDHTMERVDFVVHGHIQTQTNVQRDCWRLIHDIRTAMWVDPTRGGLALLTWVEDSEVWLPMNNEGLAQVMVRAFVLYETDLADLTSTIPS